jgi:hypothetical protein
LRRLYWGAGRALPFGYRLDRLPPLHAEKVAQHLVERAEPLLHFDLHQALPHLIGNVDSLHGIGGLFTSFILNVRFILSRIYRMYGI